MGLNDVQLLERGDDKELQAQTLEQVEGEVGGGSRLLRPKASSMVTKWEGLGLGGAGIDAELVGEGKPAENGVGGSFSLLAA
ncbi:hypothetical protein [Streptomyces sp. Mo3]|uniref:hypothetical protein n=1 Tax=Streptomyces sp. Mo3 TaxID=3161190 RepID=UPI0039EFB5F4